METQTTEKAYSTKGYHISIKKSECMLPHSILKIWFGSRYYIMRAKLTKQALDSMGIQLRTGLSRKGGFPDTHLYYHIVNYIKRTRCLLGTAEIIGSGYTPLQLLKEEQKLLDDSNGDELCLNNNVQAYVPIGNQLLTEAQKQQFLVWYEKTRKKK